MNFLPSLGLLPYLAPFLGQQMGVNFFTGTKFGFCTTQWWLSEQICCMSARTLGSLFFLLSVGAMSELKTNYVIVS